MTPRVKLIVNVPISHADAVRKAIGDAGGGRTGDYSHCSFTVRGIGRFTPGPNAKPFIGKPGEPAEVEEEQVQVDIDPPDLKKVIAAMKAAHPYEEIGYEIYKVLTEEGE